MKLRRVRTLVVREVRATLRDPFTLTTLVAVPILALLAFSSVLATKVEGMRLGVFDASQSAASRRLVADLAAVGAFEPVRLRSRDQIGDFLRAGQISVALVIPRDFEPTLARRSGADPPELQALFDGAETVLAANAEAYLGAIAAASGAKLALRDLSQRGATAAGGATPPHVTATVHALFNPELSGTPFMVAGTFGFVLSFVTVLITAVSIVNERLQGTFDQLQLTPATTPEILLGKLLPMGAVFSLDVVLMVVVAGLVLGVWPAGNLIFFLSVATFYVTTTLALGLIFSATSATAAEAVQKTILFSIPLVQLSGFAFPIPSMPTPVQWLAELIPATHFIRVTRAIYLRGAGPLDLWWELLVLALFALALVALALRTLSRRA